MLKRILQVILIAIPSAGFGDEIPKELTNGLVAEFDKFFCSDTEFIQCAGVKNNSCSNVVDSAVRSCDYSPVWKEIQKSDDSEEAADRLSAEGERFGSCVNTELQQRLSISSSIFDLCITELQEKYADAHRKRLRSH